MSASDAIEGLSSPLKDRLRHPLLGAFVLVWPIVNWQMLLILGLDEAPITERLDYIGQFHWKQSHVLWAPLISALLFVTFAPWVRYFHYFYCSIPDFLRQRRQLNQEQKTAKEKARLAELSNRLEIERAERMKVERIELEQNIQQAQRRREALEKSIGDLEARRSQLRRRHPRELAGDLFPSVIQRDDIRHAMHLLNRRIRELREMDRKEVETPGQLYLPFPERNIEPK